MLKSVKELESLDDTQLVLEFGRAMEGTRAHYRERVGQILHFRMFGTRVEHRPGKEIGLEVMELLLHNLEKFDGLTAGQKEDFRSLSERYVQALRRPVGVKEHIIESLDVKDCEDKVGPLKEDWKKR